MRSLVISQAKSGSSAMMVMIANAMGTSIIYNEPPANTLHTLPSNCVVKVLFENTVLEDLLAVLPQFDKVVLLLRDPRDNYVSRILYSLGAQKDCLVNDEFIDNFLVMLQKKQKEPASVDLTSLADMLGKDTLKNMPSYLQRYDHYLEFVEQRSPNWFLMYYEDMVTGNLQKLSSYLNLQAQPVEMPERWQRVSRSKRSGDWRHWLTNNDVNNLAPHLSPILKKMSYENDWQLAEPQEILAEHCQDYVLRLVHERRQAFGMPRYTPPLERDASAKSCNICGYKKFGPGPNGRKAENGQFPACMQCGALERQRAIRSLIQALPIGMLSWRNCLQVREDVALASNYFNSHKLLKFDAKTNISLESLPALDGSFDFIYLNYVLEFVPNDLQVFDEMLRVLSPKGILLICFVAPHSREQSTTLNAAPPAQLRAYGRDLKKHLGCQQKNLFMLEVTIPDPWTKLRQVVHLFCKDLAEKEKLVGKLQSWHGSEVSF